MLEGVLLLLRKYFNVTFTEIVLRMLKKWNALLNLGITEDLNEVEKNQIKMVNFGSLFVTIAGITFFLESLEIGNTIFSIALIASPFFFSSVLISNYYKKTKVARNILFFGVCFEISVYSLLDSPSSFTLNYFFGIAMFSFIVYNKMINKIFGLILCVILYFALGYIQPKIQSILPFDPVIYVLDVVTLFSGILFCTYYFIKTNNDYNSIVIKQKLELERININKTKLLSILTHDIRNPINSLNHLLNLQKEKELSLSELNFLFDKLRKEFVMQFQSIETLLEWSQNQLTEINLKREKTQVDQLIVNLIKELNYSITLKEINLGISICGNDTIDIDKTHLIIILRNLLNNALKFTRNNGHIYITTSFVQNKYRIDIEDDGIGFDGYSSIEFKEFDSFVQHHGTNNEKGNGLGLTISQELVEKNNGKLFIKNNEYNGAVVRLEFSIYKT